MVIENWKPQAKNIETSVYVKFRLRNFFVVDNISDFQLCSEEHNHIIYEEKLLSLEEKLRKNQQYIKM